MENNLLHSILFQPWMIDDRAARAYHPIVAGMLKGNTLRKVELKQPHAFSYSGMQLVRYGRFEDAPQGSVAVHCLIGAVTKYGGWCTYGTEDLMINMSRVDEMDNISAHLLEIDSGGGEATNIESVAQFIRTQIKKPVVAWFNGTCASAAYYVASAADEVYASENTDIVGSIGVVFNFLDFKAYYESQGIKVHEVYATQSTLKNADIHAAKEEDYGPLREKLLDPYAQQFIDTVKSFRPGLQEKEAYAGQIYTAPKAIEIGMIDGLKTFDQAVQRALELSANQNSIQQMDIGRINQVLGYELNITEGGVFLNEEELNALNAAVVAENQESLNTDILNLQTAQTDLNGEVETLRAELTSLRNDFEAFKKGPGAESARGFSEKDPQSEKEEDYQNIENAYEAAAKAGSSVRFVK